MARLTIPDEQTYATFTVATPTDTFPFTFSLFAKADLRVSVDGAELTQADFSLTGTLLEGGGYDGGAVVLNDEVNECDVRIWRDIAPVRTSNFAPAQSTPSGSIDQAFNRLTAIAQDHDYRLSQMDPEIAADAAAVASAQAAIALGATVQTAADVLAAQAAADLAEAEAEQTAADRAATELLVDDAEAYVAAIPPDVTYATDAAGRTGVAVDGALYWLRTTDGLQLRSRTNSSTSADVVDGSSNPIIIFSLNGIYTRIQYIPCVASAVTSGNNYSITPEDSRVRYSGVGTQYRWTYEAPAANTVGSGSVDVTVKNGAGTTFFTAGIRKAGSTVLDGTEFETGNGIELRRMKASENVGQPLLWISPPNPAIKQLSGAAQTANLQAPSRDKPVMIQKHAQRVLGIRALNIAFDDPDLALECDESEVIYYEMSRAMSLSAAKTVVSWAVNSQRAVINGQQINYCNFLSNEASASVFDREGHSAVEPVFRVGLMASATSTYNPIGNGHGGMVNTAGDCTLTLYDNVSFNTGTVEIAIGDVVTGQTSGAVGTVYAVTPTAGSWGTGNKTGYLHMKDREGAFTVTENLRVGGATRAKAASTGLQANSFATLAIGSGYNCAESKMVQRYDIYSDLTDLSTWCGELTYIHRTNIAGTHFGPTVARGGRRLAFDAGSNEIVAGASINGATSGATATVVYVSATGFTGTWGGGTAAGTMFLTNVVGTFQDNETIRVGATTKAVVNGTIGPAVGMANQYGPLMVSKAPNRAKINGYPAIEIGNSDGSQRPSNIAPYADGNDPYTGVPYAGTWTVSSAPDETPSPMQFWHTRNVEPGRTIIMEMLFDGPPMTPPGDYSWCDNSQAQLEDRAGSTHKFSVNTTSGIARAFEGTFTVPAYTHRFRVGDPV